MLEFVSIEGSPNSYRIIVEIYCFLFILCLIMKVCYAATAELLIC
jgi:hypothetical protein